MAYLLRFVALVASCIAMTRSGLAQPTATPTPPVVEGLAPDGKSKPLSGWAGLPIATYTPETSLGLGVFGTRFFRLADASPETRPSSVSVVGLYTLRSQLIVEFMPELYWNADRAHIWSKFDYRHYPNSFWAIGAKSPESSKESYTESRWRWQGRVGHSLHGSLFLYGQFELTAMEVEPDGPQGLLASDAVTGARGGITVALGPALVWDTRDHSLTPHTGELHSFSLSGSYPLFGSEYEFTTLVCDLRRYLPITETHTLVANVVFKLQDGDAPFYQLPRLGGAELLRGYFEGRFRDKTLLLAQAEYRLPLFWRLGAVGFAGLGGVSRTLRDFRFDAPEWSVGGGLRLLLNRNEQLNLRADLGFGRNSFGLYVSAGEVF